MTDTQRITITVSTDNLNWLDANYNNRSAFIDDLLTDYRESGGQTENVVAEFRKRQIEAEIASLKSQLESAREQREAIADSVTTHEERQREIAREAVDQLGIDPGVGYDHAAAENWADKAGMDTEDFWDLYAEVYADA